MIAAEDTRHGTRPGYIAGCRQDCCRVPHIRYQKRARLRLLREGTQVTSAAPVNARLAWWARYGVSRDAIANGGNLGGGTLAELATGRRDVILKSNAAKALAVTWDDLPDNALCNAELTRARIHSLMAAGHPLAWIVANVAGLSVSGRWRRQEKVTMRLARGVQALYERAPLQGPSLATATKARRRGFQHPLAWDDPGTPAAPTGWTLPIPDVESGRGWDDSLDEAMVLRVLNGGSRPRRMTHAEGAEVVRRLLASGRTTHEIKHVWGMKPERYFRIGDVA